MAKLIDAIIKLTDGSIEVSTINEDIDNINWHGNTPLNKADIQAKLAELNQAEEDAKTQKEANKASAKAKLIAGEALTEAEADTIVL